METITIDRFEGDFAICEREDCSMISIERSRLPRGIRVGNILRFFEDGSIKIDVDAELKRKELIRKLQDNLFKNED